MNDIEKKAKAIVYRVAQAVEDRAERGVLGTMKK